MRNRSRGGSSTAGSRPDLVGPDPADTYEADAIALMAQRRYADAETLLREALRLRPNSARLVNRLGSSVWEQGRPSEAEPLFARAVELSPNDSVFSNNLGLALWDQGRHTEAAECYRRALDLNPDANDVRMNLGVVLSDLGRFDEAIEHLREAVRIDPASPDTLQNLGMTLGRMGRWPEALDYYDRALCMRPDYAEVHRNRAYGWLYTGDFERGWPEHEWRLRCRRHVGCKVQRHPWRGEPLDGRGILLHAEQGFGDTLQFIRYAAKVKERGGLVLVAAQTRLLRIVARCPGVDLAFDGTSAVPSCHVHAPLMSLPAIFGTTQSTVPNQVPYLPTEPVVVERWRQALGAAIGSDLPAVRDERGALANGRRDRPVLVGVAWQGSPQNPMDRFRSFPLAELASVADVPGVRLVCVQAVDGLEQIPALNGRFPIIELPSKRPRDFLDTAALISLLDLVITPDTAVAHLAGGLGIPVWLALSTVGEWRWMLGREDSPWYPTMRIFRQARFGEWDTVFRRMADVLRDVQARRSTSAA
jgi:tetratricopeptide (TPR) repeat protein